MAELINPARDPRCIMLVGGMSPVHDPQGIWPGGITANDLRRKLAAVDHTHPLLCIESGGGGTSSGFEMADVIESDPRTITGVGRVVLSAAVVPFSSCDRRFMLPGGRLRFHVPICAMAMPDDIPPDALDQAIADWTVVHIVHFCMRWPHVAAETFGEWMEAGREFTAEECVEAGLAEGILQ